MTIENPPLYLQNDGPSAEQHRDVMHPVHGGRPGIVLPTAYQVTEKSGGANMSVDVSSGRCFVKGNEATYQGYYLVHNRGNTNVTIDASDPTNDRIDLVVIRVRDSAYSGASDSADLFIVKGTPAASPVADTASIPDNAHILAEVLVGNGVTSITNANITDLRTLDTYAPNDNGTSALPSGKINCLSTDRPLDNLYVGMEIYETDTAVHRRWDGSSWDFVSRDGDGVWQGYTPTFTNFTATIDHARYTRIGDTYHVSVRVTLSGAPTGTLKVSLPANASTSYNDNQSFGTMSIRETGVTSHSGLTVMDTSRSDVFFRDETGATINATVPFTWASGDWFTFEITYEAA